MNFLANISRPRGHIGPGKGMEELVASSLGNVTFDFEWFVKDKLGLDVDGNSYY
jgi:hypothetical protein